MMKRFGLVLTLCSLAQCVSAADVVTQGAGGGINWTQGYIWAHGYGVARDNVQEPKKRLLARRAAQVDAYRNLAEYVKGVRVSSESVVQTMVLASDTVRARIETVVRGAVMHQDHYQNEVAQVTLRIYMDGDFSSSLNQASLIQTNTAVLSPARPPVLWFENLARTLGRFAVSPAYAMDDQGRLVRTDADLELAERLLRQSGQQDPKQLLQQLQDDARVFRESSTYTGILVDASGVPDFVLATIPRIRDPEGNVVYPRDELFSSSLAAKRPVSYDFDVHDAIRNSRIAVTPYVIKAQSVYRSRNSDLVISAEAARFIAENNQFREIAKQAGVMIVVAE